MVAYLDSSALVKLVVREDETAALRAWLAGVPQCATSVLARTEVIRAVRRAAPELVEAAVEVCEALHLLAVPPAVFRDAAHLDPPELRSLDALHLAAARLLGDELSSFVSYDTRLLAAAERLGMPVAAPA
ncbi:MAG: type II toxin-antitoxin system VapC family toxin [Protaetiibacter sp.]